LITHTFCVANFIKLILVPSTNFAHISHVPMSCHSRWPTKCVGILLNILPSIPQCMTLEKIKTYYHFASRFFFYTCDSYDLRALNFNYILIFSVVEFHELEKRYSTTSFCIKTYINISYMTWKLELQQVPKLLKVQHNCIWRLGHVCLWIDPIESGWNLHVFVGKYLGWYVCQMW
jgi:hypothetical protein